jgi:hypothetical protein
MLSSAITGTVFLIGFLPIPRPTQDEYEFKLDSDRVVVIMRGDYYLFGKLDKSGDFAETGKASITSGLSAGSSAILNHPFIRGRAVYEYRSGRLIKGMLDRSGAFVPEVSSKVIDFKDYRYSPDAIHIWNLPGTFVPKNPKK